MRSREQDSVATYNQFREGQQLSFTLNQINPDGTISSKDYETHIKAVKGGGFFGQFLILEGLSFGLKTAIPDPWHDFWRRLNWGFRDFPYQVSEVDAKLGHLATNLMHDAVYPLSGGKFYSPESPGYTLLPGTYAQGIECLYGRPPRYDNGRNEYSEFRQTQKEATELYYKLGLEHVGQVHEKNPFAMANVWLNEKEGRWELFDTLPAIRHKGRVWPIIRPFLFHKEIRETLNPETGEITFDRIHTDIFSRTIDEHAGEIQEEALRRIKGNLVIYKEVLAEKDREPLKGRKYKAAIGALVESGVGFGRAVVTTAKEVAVTPYQLIREPKKLDELVLGGARKALATNTITQEEFDEYIAMVNDFSEKEAKENKNILTKLWQGSMLSALYAYYHIGGGFLKPFEFAAYLNSGQIADNISSTGTFVDVLVRTAVIFGIFSAARVAGGINSFLATKTLSCLSGKNLNTAAIVSAVPGAGIHAAIPFQFCVDAGSESDRIWHYTVRNLIAKFSKINPAGGWGSEFEGQLWRLLGDKIIRWAK